MIDAQADRTICAQGVWAEVQDDVLGNDAWGRKHDGERQDANRFHRSPPFRTNDANTLLRLIFQFKRGFPLLQWRCIANCMVT
jgi:hypothetical protein